MHGSPVGAERLASTIVRQTPALVSADVRQIGPSVHGMAGNKGKCFEPEDTPRRIQIDAIPGMTEWHGRVFWQKLAWLRKLEGEA